MTEISRRAYRREAIEFVVELFLLFILFGVSVVVLTSIDQSLALIGVTVISLPASILLTIRLFNHVDQLVLGRIEEQIESADEGKEDTRPTRSETNGYDETEAPDVEAILVRPAWNLGVVIVTIFAAMVLANQASLHVFPNAGPNMRGIGVFAILAVTIVVGYVFDLNPFMTRDER